MKGDSVGQKRRLWCLGLIVYALGVASCGTLHDHRDAQALKSGECHRMVAAAESIRERKAIERLADLVAAVQAKSGLKEEECASAIAEQAMALVSENRSEAVGVLARLLRDRKFRLQACFFLREGGEQAVPVLLNTLKSPDWDLALVALDSLACMRLGPEFALRASLDLLESPDGEFRALGAFALAKLGAPADVSSTEWARLVREDPYSGVRWTAVGLLGMAAYEDPQVLRWIKTVAETDPDAGVRELAARVWSFHQEETGDDTARTQR